MFIPEDCGLEGFIQINDLYFYFIVIIIIVFFFSVVDRYGQRIRSEEQLRRTKEQLRVKDDQLEIYEMQLREKDKLVREKDERLKVNDKQLRRTQEQLRVKDEQLKMKEGELKDLRDQLQDFAVVQNKLSAAEKQLTKYESKSGSADWVLCRDEVQLSDESLGVGSFGRVVKGRYCGCVVAIKQLHLPTLNQRQRHSFEREMDIASRCRHPCLLQFIGATEDESPLFVTEIMETSLQNLLQKRKQKNQHLTETDIIFISLDVARALNYLHQRKPESIVHRDVSSANVLLWKQNNLWRGKLGDYGTAKFLQETMTVAPGAMIYAAPEIGSPFKQTVKVSLLYGISL